MAKKAGESDTAERSSREDGRIAGRLNIMRNSSRKAKATDGTERSSGKSGGTGILRSRNEKADETDII